MKAWLCGGGACAESKPCTVSASLSPASILGPGSRAWLCGLQLAVWPQQFASRLQLTCNDASPDLAAPRSGRLRKLDSQCHDCSEEVRSTPTSKATDVPRVPVLQGDTI